MEASRLDYTAERVAAARSVLLELFQLLGEYREDIVVVGGWVPELLLADPHLDHVGSIDVDLALNHLTLREAGYKSIEELLEERGYRRDPDQPFRYYRSLRMGDKEIEVEVDLLAGEYAGTGKRHRTQRVQGVQPRKARGCDLAFVVPAQEVSLETILPEGGRNRVRVRVASVVPFLAMKGIALRDRLKPKDAWDIYFVIRHFPGGLEALVEEFRPHLSNGLVREGLQSIAERFASTDHVGPKWVADFDNVTDSVERELVQRDAYERVNYLLVELGIER